MIMAHYETYQMKITFSNMWQIEVVVDVKLPSGNFTQNLGVSKNGFIKPK